MQSVLSISTGLNRYTMFNMQSAKLARVILQAALLWIVDQLIAVWCMTIMASIEALAQTATIHPYWRLQWIFLYELHKHNKSTATLQKLPSTVQGIVCYFMYSW